MVSTLLDHFNGDHDLVFMFIPKKEIPVQKTEPIRISWRPTIITTAVFIFFFFGVFRIVNIVWPMLIAIILALAINPRIMLKIDYALLLTFTGFFIFISDIQQIPAIVNLIHMTVHSESSTYFASILTSQIMSNVPSTIWLVSSLIMRKRCSLDPTSVVLVPQSVQWPTCW